MVKNFSQQFYFFRACPAKKRIINNQYIAAFLIGKRFNFPNNSRSELKRKSAPVDAAGIHKAIKGVFSKRDGVWRLPLFLEKWFIAESIFKGYLEYRFDRKPTYFVRIAGFENLSYMEFFKKMRNFRGKEFTRLMILYSLQSKRMCRLCISRPVSKQMLRKPLWDRCWNYGGCP